MSDLDATHYRNNSSTQYALAHEMLSAIEFIGTETILDVGCGDGRITAELSKCVPHGHVTGIDPSPGMIDLAKQSFPKNEYPNLQFHANLAEAMQLEQPIDIVLLMNTLHWIREPAIALGKIAAALKPGGSLYILTYPKESPFWQILNDTILEKEWISYADQSAYNTILTTQEYQKLLEHCGFVVEQCTLEEKIAAYSSARDLMAFVKGWLNCYLPLPKTLEEAFLQRAVKNALSYSLRTPEIQLPYHKLTIKARKESAYH